ncbi:peptide-methionine (S)-S-oxide reductase MsrA [Pelomonas sp. KK5]|uniref:peptide-methionine (S)-S-oxide reductase MsrA n=1 Tax=Pelomonas sp. KK5 TaxID=1855730 RepID=UPI00097C020B|nr:peptide-methionine (S)-S-oxide reductase MsrA [Pelomonas sp. KK5]
MRSRSPLVPTVMAGLCAALLAWQAVPASTEARLVPPLLLQQRADAPAAAGEEETAVFAGGCFWGVQAVFQHVKGVSAAISGYAGGAARSADYHSVGTGSTGHAESVQVRFDPRQVSYAQLLQVYFSVAHDPTQLNRQGPDSGPQYRSTVFPTSEAQARTARAYIDQLGAARVFGAPVVTTVEPGKPFYPAEAYHQDYLVLHPDYPYIVINDQPKVAALKKLFPQLWREQPVLVAKAR